GQRAQAQQSTLDQDAIDQQVSLLKAHRARLNVLLEQQARLGVAYAPPGVAIGIDEARDDIRRIKEILRRAGAIVDDSPNDDASAASAPTAVRDEPATSLAVPDKRALREALIQTFSLDELDVLCADVEQDLAADGITTQVNLELVGGSGKVG